MVFGLLGHSCPIFQVRSSPFVRFPPGAVKPVRVAPVVLPRSLLVTLPEVSTWHLSRVFPGFLRCVVAGFFLGGRDSVERIGNDVNKKGKAGQKYVYIYI